ncbi:hypothetical protein Ddye_011658 [Dipteronia dyeriana]|uniref:FRIGIDA-like protein n=1 Tax=Dipteronia dyeriana TaxID=168575 RepID=A0AAD9X305_9ROSI|nr:hypothetical protein Ddye_011658 [Dipteronia dyeriana]
MQTSIVFLVTEIIQKLIKEDRRLEAIECIFAFELVNEFPPVQLLMDEKKNATKISKMIRRESPNSLKPQIGNMFYLETLGVLKMRSRCELGDHNKAEVNKNKGLALDTACKQKGELRNVIGGETGSHVFNGDKVQSDGDGEVVNYSRVLWKKLVVNNTGKSGDLCLYQSHDIDVELLTYSQNHIDIKIRQNRNQVWRFTYFYGNPEQSQRTHSWTFLHRIARMMDILWVCMGDFTDIVCVMEKLVGPMKNWHSMAAFKKVLEDCNLDDKVDYKGGRIRIGVIIRDSFGSFMASCSSQVIIVCFEAKVDEMVAIFKGLQFNTDCGLAPYMIELDAVVTVKWVNERSHLNSEDEVILSGISNL